MITHVAADDAGFQTRRGGHQGNPRARVGCSQRGRKGHRKAPGFGFIELGQLTVDMNRNVDPSSLGGVDSRPELLQQHMVECACLIEKRSSGTG